MNISSQTGPKLTHSIKNPFKTAFQFSILITGLGILSVMLLTCGLGLTLACKFLKGDARKKLARRTIMRVFKSYLAMLDRFNIVKVDSTGLDQLAEEPSLILAPNHPSLLDAVLVTSRLPDVVCIMKAEVLKNILFSRGATIAGYISNGSVRDMVNASVKELNDGSQLLLFPEGTRTVGKKYSNLKGSLAVIAKRANAEVQTIFIESDSGFLGKNWPLFKAPEFPVYIRIRPGRRFAPPQDVKHFMSELETYFQNELAPEQNRKKPAPVREEALAEHY